jgi:hypothetical protein
MLSALHGSCHPSDVEPNAPGNEQPILVPATHRSIQGGGSNTRHDSNAQGHLLGMRGHATSLQLELHRCLSAWSVGCLDYIFPLVTFSYILSGLTYVSLSGNSKSVSPMGRCYFYVVRRCLMTGLLIHWFQTWRLAELVSPRGNSVITVWVKLLML